MRQKLFRTNLTPFIQLARIWTRICLIKDINDLINWVTCWNYAQNSSAVRLDVNLMSQYINIDWNDSGSLLLDSLKEHISTTAQDHCKAIYLHVLTTNNTAINFYENRDFRQHHYLPYYYSIRGVLKDGFTYVLYINGGHPPWTILYPFLEAGKYFTYSLLFHFLWAILVQMLQEKK